MSINITPNLLLPPPTHRSGARGEQASRWETEWRLDTERFRAESERLKGQVEALKEIGGRQREEMRDKETYLNRYYSVGV